MKRFKLFVLGAIFLMIYVCFNGYTVSAKDVLKEKSSTNIFGDVLGTIEIYDNGQVSIKYKYGLRKAEVFYCEKGSSCENNVYSIVVIMESNSINTYKNDDVNLAIYNYTINLERDKEYKVKVRAYIATSKSYTGTENLTGSPIITSFQTETDEANVKGGSATSDGSIGDEGINGLMGKLKNIVNTIVIPILYTITGLVLIIKGALLGTQIVKSADDPYVRSEKVRALKWLVIGVAITFVASTLVGVITGFFGDVFK